MNPFAPISRHVRAMSPRVARVRFRASDTTPLGGVAWRELAATPVAARPTTLTEPPNSL